MTKDNLKKVVEKSKKMIANGEYRDPGFEKLARAVVELVEGSDFGEKNSEATLTLESSASNWVEETLDDSFDGVCVQLLEISSDCLGDFGTLFVVPYSSGLSKKSAMIRFKVCE
ncbi:hypothetical protein C0584_02365 [Candidatus Parcubacteria bacterium]|nr:MAG: hypothetical protein C0584_02365 [Candidatus Parcubacteria bacterium]